MINEEKLTTNDRFRDICRRNKWKCTAQRRSIFGFLHDNKEHPTVEMVWTNVRKHLPEVSLDSVYRILDEFAAIGLLRRLESDRVIRYDPDTTPHAHFLCSNCGRMFDFHHAEAGSVSEICRQFGMVTVVELSVRGICHHCISRQENIIQT